MKPRTTAVSLTLLGIAVLGLGLWASRTHAGADKISFPASFKDGVLYTIADRPNMKGAVEVKK